MFVGSDGLAGVVFADSEYPARVAFTLLNKLMDEFRQLYADGSWKQASADLAFPFPKLNERLSYYQDPHNADVLLKINRDLDETKIILHKSIESALDRGQKLEDLIARTNDLSAMSKAFAKDSKALNRCCVIL
eukprot:c8921_g1_i1.p1 GENE.c8921_g1_i1~~c8921_g1_i1.p1  ORF type:complete len:133 (+),score=25.02 c8921_g1_i1:680-1078(+)